jgi:hypothetical protein
MVVSQFSGEPLPALSPLLTGGGWKGKESGVELEGEGQGVGVAGDGTDQVFWILCRPLCGNGIGSVRLSRSTRRALRVHQSSGIHCLGAVCLLSRFGDRRFLSFLLDVNWLAVEDRLLRRGAKPRLNPAVAYPREPQSEKQPCCKQHGRDGDRPEQPG